MLQRSKFGALAAVAVATAMSLSGCMKDKCTRTVTYSDYRPVYMTYDQIRQPIAAQAPRTIEQAGKIYLYDRYLLLGEVGDGIHVFDISGATASPVAFLPIVGNKDMAIRNNILYADNYTDLVAIDISDIQRPVTVGRTENVFINFFSGGMDDGSGQGMLVDYEPYEVTAELDCQEAQWRTNGGWGGNGGGFIGGPTVMEDRAMGAPTNMMGGGGSAESGGGRGSSTGIGGSMARFTIVGSHLYTVDEMGMRIFDISDASNAQLANTVDIGWGIETIFPANGSLFIGSNTGMFIYSLTDPTNPTLLSEFQHAEACDPVFVSGNHAYVTLRTGTMCANGSNELNVLDVTDLTNPVLLATYPMHNPHGLSVLNETLYLCEGDGGLKGFDVTDKLTIDQHEHFHFTGFDAYDVIASPYQPVLLVTGADGLRLYDNTQAHNPTLVSTIAVQ